MEDVDLNYEVWCRRIAEARDLDDLISHFREHVCEHFERHNRGDPVSLDVWLIGVLNFMHILEKKCQHITKKDMLFKLCTYYKNHKDGPEPPFDVDEFIEKYDGPVKKFYKHKTK